MAETAGEHFTPREVIRRLMVNLLLCEDSKALTEPGVIRTIYDPACGTGGMLSVAEEYLRELNNSAKLVAFGQELNPESFAVCKSDPIIKGQDPVGIAFGNSFSEDGHSGKTFDHCISNPPFGVEWKNVENAVTDEHERKGTAGRFGAGLPRVSDGSLLFVQHMISKFPKDGGTSRLAVVLNGSRCLRAVPVRARVKSDGGSSITTGWKRSSVCRIRYSIIPVSAPTSGLSRVRRRTGAVDRRDWTVRENAPVAQHRGSDRGPASTSAQKSPQQNA